MTLQERIIEIQIEIQNLEVQNSDLFTFIKGAIKKQDLKAKALYNQERQFVSARIKGLRAEMQYLQNYGKDY